MVAERRPSAGTRSPGPEDRAALLRAFIAWCGDASVAEDLTQETLYAAWTSHRAPAPDGEWRPWLFGVARNILLRWRREQAKHRLRVASAPESEHHLLAAASADDLDAFMHRADIVALLDDALGHLPKETRQALLMKYVDDLPQAEIAARMMVHEKALEGRLHRGKRALHRFLITERPDSAVRLGLIAEPDTWITTDIWCTTCGTSRLVGRWWENGYVRLDCPSCVDWTPWERSHVYSAGFPLAEGQPRRPSFAKAVELIASRFTALETDGRDMTMPCPRCGGVIRPSEHIVPAAPNLGLGPDLRFACETCCHIEGYCWLAGGHSSRDDVRAWWKRHPRTRMLKPALIRFQERDAIASTWSPLDGDDRLTIVRDLETWRVLHINLADRPEGR